VAGDDRMSNAKWTLADVDRRCSEEGQRATRRLWKGIRAAVTGVREND